VIVWRYPSEYLGYLKLWHWDKEIYAKSDELD
jgi:hypothetical protein